MEHSGFELSALALAGGIAIVGFYTGRIAKRFRLPSLIGYMILGVLIGPSALGVLNHDTMDSMSFITDVALGFVAFSIGAELSLKALRRLGYGIIVIIVTESFLAFGIVTAAIYFIWHDLPMALLFGAMAPASAPAGTVAVIHELKAKGTLTKALYAVVGFDDGLAIIIFGFALAIAKSTLIFNETGEETSLLPSLVGPAQEVVLSVVVGTIVGFGFCQLARKLRHKQEIFIMVFGAVLVATGLSLQFHLSLILTNMVVGFVLVNTRRENFVHRVMTPVQETMPLLFILFFCLAGAHLDLAVLPTLGSLGVVYIVGRSTGLLSGAWIGAVLGRSEPKIRKYLGMGILSQAGVAIGLALIVNKEFGELAEDRGFESAATIGVTVLTTITATSIFFELIEPILTKIALQKAGETNV